MGDKFTELKTPEELGGVLTGLNDKVTEVDERVKTAVQKEELDPIIAGMRETIDTIKAEKDQMLEKIKSLTFASEAQGTWKTKDTPKAHAYGIGKMYQAMFEEQVYGSAVAQKILSDMGCVRTRQTRDGWESAEAQNVKQEVFMGENLLSKAGLSDAPLTGDNSVGSYLGSYVVPVDYGSELERIALDASTMMSRVTRVPVRGITAYIPTSVDELAFTAVTNQDTDKTEETFTFGRSTLTTVTYAAYLAVVEEFIEDSLVAIGEIVRDSFGEAWGKKFDTLCLSDSTYGAMSASGIKNKVMSAGNSSFENVDPEDLHLMVAELDTRWKRTGGEYFMAPTVWDYLERAKNADGDYYFGPPADARPARAWGHPVNLTDGMPDSGDSDASTSFVAFGNPKRIFNGYRVAFEFKIYAETQSAMESGQIFLRVRTRQAFALPLPTTWVKLTTAA